MGEGMTTLDSACDKCTPGLDYQEQSAQASCKPFSCKGECDRDRDDQEGVHVLLCICDNF